MSNKRDRLAEAREKLKKGDITDAQLLAEKRDRDRIKEQKREHKKIVKALEKELSVMSAQTNFLDALESAPEPKPMKIRKRREQQNAGTYVMRASDWHLGERVRPENIRNKNEYNPEISQERAEQYFRSQLRLLNNARDGWDIRDGVLWLGGDLMTGYIHEEYLEENFLSPVEEALLAYRVLVRGIDYLLAESDLEQLLIPTSNGNHGRTGQRIKIATYAKNSFEWMLYHFLDSHYSDEPRVKFQIANGVNNVVDCYGFRLGFSHGDNYKYGGGVGGLSVPVNRKIGRQLMGMPIEWEGTDKASPHLYIFGHYHQTLFPGNFMVNGSLIGWNDFAEWLGCAYEPPRQTGFVIDERYKAVSNYNPVFVTKGKK